VTTVTYRRCSNKTYAKDVIFCLRWFVSVMWSKNVGLKIRPVLDQKNLSYIVLV